MAMIPIGGEIFRMYSIFRADPQISLEGVGGKEGSGGQEGGEVHQCYINIWPSDLRNLPGDDLSRAVHMHSTTNFTGPNDAAQSSQDTTDKPTGDFLELEDYEITIVLRPVGLALQTETSNVNSFPNEPTAHELVAWKVIRLCEGIDIAE
ncbi:hypothetical protein C8J57DRAFT_1341047 [Mycena rebaudengoi]|nr:hypothetical protein C8J57DRAFT_1341047 [Mycena rebaudengoi]